MSLFVSFVLRFIHFFFQTFVSVCLIHSLLSVYPATGPFSSSCFIYLFSMSVSLIHVSVSEYLIYQLILFISLPRPHTCLQSLHSPIYSFFMSVSPCDLPFCLCMCNSFIYLFKISVCFSKRQNSFVSACLIRLFSLYLTILFFLFFLSAALFFY